MTCDLRMQGSMFPKTWVDCYGCRTSFADGAACAQRRGGRRVCEAPPFLTLSVSMYAAQLSWWFAHFPQNRFMVVTSAEMHAADPTSILNSVSEFTGIHAQPFYPAMMRDVWGYSGGYNATDLSTLDLKAFEYLQLFYRQANADLQALLAPLNVSALPHEVQLPAH